MSIYRLLADLILIIHAGFIVFVVVGLLLILIGKAAGWTWVRNFWFRAAHLLAIVFVVIQAQLGVACPLTIWENDLRIRAGQTPYSGEGFIEHWLHEMFFFDAETWVFTLAYTLFGLLVLLTMIFIPPRWPKPRAA